MVCPWRSSSPQPAQPHARPPEGIEAALDNRFQLLLQGRRTAMPRHRTLAAAIDWSYDQLD